MFRVQAFTTPMDRLTLTVLITAVLGPARAAAALAKYPIPANETDCRAPLSHAVSDLLFHCSTRNATRSVSLLLSLCFASVSLCLPASVSI